MPAKVETQPVVVVEPPKITCKEDFLEYLLAAVELSLEKEENR